jgi:hypothetical protein
MYVLVSSFPDDKGLRVAVSGNGTSFYRVGSSDIVFRPPGGTAPFGDPFIIRYRGAWYVAYTRNNGGKTAVGLAKSIDLAHWTQVLQLTAVCDGRITPMAFTQLIVDPAGGVHWLVFADALRRAYETHPISGDPGAWGEPKNWSSPVGMADGSGHPLNSGNCYIAYRESDDTYYWFADQPNGRFDSHSYYVVRTRTRNPADESASLQTGWSAPVILPIDLRAFGVLAGDNGDLMGAAWMPGEVLRLWMTCINTHLVYYADSSDEGKTWTTPAPVAMHGFDAAFQFAGFTLIRLGVDDLAPYLPLIGK